MASRAMVSSIMTSFLTVNSDHLFPPIAILSDLRIWRRVPQSGSSLHSAYNLRLSSMILGISLFDAVPHL